MKFRRECILRTLKRITHWKNKMINSIHKEMTDDESYENQKLLYKSNPSAFLSPKEWKKRRLLVLQKEGRVWSK